MKNFPMSIAAVYIAFFTLIGVAVYFTNSAFPLLALILTPNWKSDE